MDGNSQTGAAAKPKGMKWAYARFCAVEAVYFAAFAVLSYQTSFLDGIGYSSGEIGLISSAAAIIATVLLPLWGLAGDKMRSARPVFAVCLLALTAVYVLLSVLGPRLYGLGLLPVTVLVVAAYIFRQPTNSLMDAWIIGEISPQSIDYGSVRKWGSIGFAVCSFLMSALVGKVIGLSAVFYILPVWTVPLLLLIFRSGGRKGRAEQDCPAKARPSAGEALKLLRLLPFSAYLVYSIGCNIYLTVTVVYFVYILRYAGCNENLLGALVGFRALMEIISMSQAPRLKRKLPMAHILALSGLLFGIEHFLYCYANGPVFLFVIMVFSGLAGGVFYSMGPHYVYGLVPGHMKNTAQTLCAFVMSCVAILGSFIGGSVIENFGVETLTRACGIIIFVLTALFAASLACFGPRVDKAKSK